MVSRSESFTATPQPTLLSLGSFGNFPPPASVPTKNLPLMGPLWIMKVPVAPRVALGGCWSRRPVVKPAGCSPRPHFTG
eukprot:5091297-Pyramimonas_sp.AAC.1